MSLKQLLGEDHISRISGDEQTSTPMTFPSGSLLEGKHIFDESPSLFERSQVDGISTKSSGATLRNNSEETEMDFEHDYNFKEQNRGSEKDDCVDESFQDNNKMETTSVQDIINYFESKAKAGDFASNNLETNVHRNSTFAITEKAAHKWPNAVSSGASSQISIDDRTSVSAETCSSAYEYIHGYNSQGLEHAHKMDILEDHFPYDKELFDENSLAISDDVGFSSQESWRRLPSSTITSSSSSYYDINTANVGNSNDLKGVHNDVYSVGNSNDMKGLHNDVYSGFLSDFNIEQYPSAYYSNRKFNSELMQLSAGNLTEEGESSKDLAKFEAELVNYVNRIKTNGEKVAGEESIDVPECCREKNPVPQACVYATEDLDPIMTRWNSLRKAEQFDFSDSFIVPVRFLSNKPTEPSVRKTDIDIEARVTDLDRLENGTSYSNVKEKIEEPPPQYDDLFMMPERSFKGEAKSVNRWHTSVLHADVKLMNEKISDIHQGSKEKKADSDVRAIEVQKLEPPALKKATKSSTYRGGNAIPWNYNRSTKIKEESKKRIEDNKLQGRNRMPTQRNSSASAKAVVPSHRASDSSLAFLKPKVAAKPPPSIPNPRKGTFSSGNAVPESPDPTLKDTNHLARMPIQKQAPKVNDKLQNSRSVSCSLDAKKDIDRKPLAAGRSIATSMLRQKPIPSRLPKPQDQSTKPGSKSALLGATRVKPDSVGKFSSTLAISIG